MTTETVSSQANTEDTCLASGENVLLQTATTNIKNPQNNQSIKAQVLLDPGSHRTYVTEKLASRLELKCLEKEIISVVTFRSTKPKQIESHVVSIELPLKDGTSFNLLANVIPGITTLFNVHLCKLEKQHSCGRVCHLKKKKEKRRKKEVSTIELLIGSDYYLELTTTEKIKLKPSLYLLGSKLEWILSGRFGERIHDAQALHGLAPKCKLINMHELINKSTNE